MDIMNSYSPEEITEEARTKLGDELYESIHKHVIPDGVIQPRLDVVKDFLKDLSISSLKSFIVSSAIPCLQ